ncbi:MAG: conjugal transfer protein TraX [Bacilli bacterium]|nr:conjugal transfer protein TraX [Bacilli bacterium]
METFEQARPYQKLSSFHLKVIAMTTMFIDHFADGAIDCLMLVNGWWNVPNHPMIYAYYIMRLIGRIAFPLYLFMLSEGMFYSHDRRKYVGRIAIFALGMGLINVLGSGILGLTPFSNYQGLFHYNAFVDLLMCASFIYFLEHDNKKLRWLAVLPVAYMVFHSIADNLLAAPMGKLYYLISSFSPDYRYYGLLLFLGFYWTKKMLTKKFEGRVNALPYQVLVGAAVIMLVTVIELVLLLVFAFAYSGQSESFNEALTRGYYAVMGYFSLYMIDPLGWPYALDGSMFGILALPLLLFYNGQIGYSAPWFRRFEYLFYPGHVLIIIAIAMFIVMPFVI